MQPQVRTAVLTNYLEVARFVGLDPYKMLRDAKINPETLADPEQLLPVGTADTLLENSARESGCFAFGLLLAETRSVASIGAVSLLLEHQATARGVLAAMVQYQSLMAGALAVSVEGVGETTIIRTDILGDIGGRQGLEYLMAMICRITGTVVKGRWRPESAHFVHDAPRDLSVHRRVFQCPLVFQSDFNGFCCSTASLEATNPTADMDMARNAQRYLEMLVPEPADGSVTERARRSLCLLLPSGNATLSKVGDNLGLQPRTLQRALEKEGRTFGALLNEVRCELAMRYLSGSAHNVSSIARMSGFASPSSFTRWFGEEFGVAPAAWRAAESKEIEQGVLSFGSTAAAFFSGPS